jgi:hypothetical protein
MAQIPLWAWVCWGRPSLGPRNKRIRLAHHGSAQGIARWYLHQWPPHLSLLDCSFWGHSWGFESDWAHPVLFADGRSDTRVVEGYESEWEAVLTHDSTGNDRPHLFCEPYAYGNEYGLKAELDFNDNHPHVNKLNKITGVIDSAPKLAIIISRCDVLCSCCYSNTLRRQAFMMHSMCRRITLCSAMLNPWMFDLQSVFKWRSNNLVTGCGTIIRR